jgi:hypothetical protein
MMLLKLANKKLAAIGFVFSSAVVFYVIAEIGISKCARDAKLVIQSVNSNLHLKLTDCRRKDAKDEILRCIDDAILFLERDH